MVFPTVSKCHLQLLESQKHCDVTFFVGEAQERVSCHKIHLIARSPVFESMFAERWGKNEEELISLADVKPSAFRQLIRFIYGDEFPTDIQSVIDLRPLADKYQVIASLMERCEKLILDEMRLENNIPLCNAGKLSSLPLLKKQDEPLISESREPSISVEKTNASAGQIVALKGITFEIVQRSKYNRIPYPRGQRGRCTRSGKLKHGPIIGEKRRNKSNGLQPKDPYKYLPLSKRRQIVESLPGTSSSDRQHIIRVSQDQFKQLMGTPCIAVDRL